MTDKRYKSSVLGYTQFKSSAVDGPLGQFEALLAQMHKPDRDRDVVVESTFKDQIQLPLAAYGHTYSQPAIGRVTICVCPNELLPKAKKAGTVRIRGQVFMEMHAGRECYESMLRLGDLQQFSYGFQTIRSHPTTIDGERCTVLDEIDCFEVSPVIAGASAGPSQLLDIKADRLTPGKAAAEIRAQLARLNPDSPAAVRKAMRDMDPSGEARGLVREIEQQLDSLMAVEFADLQRRAKALTGLTNLDLVRQRVAGYDGGGFSEQWVQFGVESALADLAQEVMRSGRFRHITEAEAIVQQWARLPAGQRVGI